MDVVIMTASRTAAPRLASYRIKKVGRPVRHSIQSRVSVIGWTGTDRFLLPKWNPAMIDRRRYWVTEPSRVFFCGRQLLWFDFRRLEVFACLADCSLSQSWDVRYSYKDNWNERKIQLSYFFWNEAYIMHGGSEGYLTMYNNWPPFYKVRMCNHPFERISRYKYHTHVVRTTK